MNVKIILSVAALAVVGVAYGSAGGPGDVHPDAEPGRTAWVHQHRPVSGGDARSCSGCHRSDLTQPGRHVVTGKPIEPMAVSVNPARLSDPKKVEKWFRRNCRWTLGRECTSGEKQDFIRYISSQ